MREKVVLLALALVMVAGAAQARRLDPNEVKSWCKQNNGTYWPTSVGHTYGCLSDLLVIVCGGVTPEQKNSCYVGRQVPPHYHLPTPPTSGDEKH